jgi:hypothetical protein
MAEPSSRWCRAAILSSNTHLFCDLQSEVSLTVALSRSEAYLHDLADRTFLKPWTVPNAYRASGKELSDLVVVFGDNVIIFSDKACVYDEAQPERWRREAIDCSVKQLSGALRELASATPRLFTDAKARERSSLADILPPPERRRFHLVGIARPDHDPGHLPSNWAGLQMVSHPTGDPLDVVPVLIDEHVVHIFDGPTIDLLLDNLDTTPDFIAYLAGRARALREAVRYTFREQDLLAASIFNWGAGEGASPQVPELDSIHAGQWEDYLRSGRAELSRDANASSRTIDRLIQHFDRCFVEGAFTGERPEYQPHEFAMRLLAAESRFSRRMIVATLDDLMREDNQTTFWSATVPSPFQPGIRYVWLTYPHPPAEAPPEAVEAYIDHKLWQRVLVTAGQFESETIVGIALPNRECTDNVVKMRVFDASKWTDDDRRQGLAIEDGFGAPERNDYLHIP